MNKSKRDEILDFEDIDLNELFKKNEDDFKQVFKKLEGFNLQEWFRELDEGLENLFADCQDNGNQ